MKRDKAYSFLKIKELNEDLRELEGIATTPEADREGDILDSFGAHFAKEIPFLWQHDHSKPVGVAQLGQPTEAGIPFTAKIAKVAEEGQLKQLTDLAWQSIKQGLVRAVSIGFKANEYSFMDNGGINFKDFEIYELSAVTVPANAGATINSVKALIKNRQCIKLLTPKEPAHKPQEGIVLVGVEPD